MQIFERLEQFRPQSLAVLRIMTGLLFLQHGTMKMLAFPAPQGSGGPLPPLILTAGILELVGGLMIIAGIFTRPVAFVLSGLMAFAYFMGHASRSFYPILNNGETAILFCFVFLYLVFAGSGAWSVDSSRKA